MLSYTSLLPRFQELTGGVDWLTLAKAVLVFAVTVFALGTIFRMIFGKGSNLTCAVSASLTILLSYLAMILVYLFLPQLRSSLPQLPFATVDEHRFVLWELSGLAGELLYPSLLRLALLALVVNVLEAVMPQGEGFLAWYLWRLLTVFAALVLYGLLCRLIEQAAPDVFGSWAKPLILCSWALILLSGVLNLLLSVALAVVNPIIGALYAFFFSNIVGRQFSKSILTTAILAGAVEALNQLGYTQFAFGSFTLAGYGVPCAILLLTLYLFGRYLL